MGNRPEFDKYSGAYGDLLRDPIRDRFAATPLFFHLRKRDLVRDFWRRRRRRGPGDLAYLDVGCGKGELLNLLGGDFGTAAGCDPSPAMLEAVAGVSKRVQREPAEIPFEAAQFDFATAVCVYHHVTPADRAALTRDIARVLKAGGVFCLIEHNPYNPMTRRIVRHTPVDANAILLSAGESRRMLEGAGFAVLESRYFLYFPETLYRWLGRLERGLGRVPLGGQYAVFAEKR